MFPEVAELLAELPGGPRVIDGDACVLESPALVSRATPTMGGMYKIDHSGLGACCPELPIAQKALRQVRREERQAVQFHLQLQFAGATPADLQHASERVDQFIAMREMKERAFRRELSRCNAGRGFPGQARE